MKTAIVTVMAILAAGTAQADGFKCEGVNTGINAKVFNHTHAGEGTRTAAVMIISDSYVNSPNKTIAKFTDENNTLKYLGYGLFQAKVDLRYIESNKKGENIAGTKLGELKTINLQVHNQKGLDFTYSNPLMIHNIKNGDILDAKLTYVKRDGEVREEKAICVRYTKN